MPATKTPALSNRKTRTRKDLLLAVARLTKQGRKPTLEEIAAEALVSRATAYRYFSTTEALLVEASIDIAVPEADAVFDAKSIDDPVARVQQVDTLLHEMILANEPALRAMLVHTLQRDIGAATNSQLPVRQNRRTPLIEAALAPARKQFKPAALKMLSKALALVIGTEAMVVFKDVLQVDDIEARKVKRWAIQALVEAAKKAG